MINTTCAGGGSLGVAQLMFAQLISTLVESYCGLHSSYPEDQSSRIFSSDEKFDFIVVGAGSAGSAIANRLSEVSKWKVLLIEAGPDPPMEANIPALFSSLLGSNYDWRYQSEVSENSCRAFQNGQCIWNKGKMLGGSSSMNVAFYARGNAKDYDQWKQLGNPGWSYENVLKYLKKLESIRSSFAVPEAHGYNGYIHVEDNTDSKIFRTSEIRELLAEAFAELGYPGVEDIAAKMQSGLSKNQGTVDNGVRDNAARAYLASILDRKNLVIMKESVVTKLLINDAKQVVGVEVQTKGVNKSIYCTKEVVLAAGAVGSPQILMLSGLGPKEHLGEFGIPLVQDLKVGFNLQDHLIVSDFHISLNMSREPYVETDFLYYYLTRGTELSHLMSGDTAYIDTLRSVEDYPDIQIIFDIFPPQFIAKLEHFLTDRGYSQDAINWKKSINEETYSLGFKLILLRPQSRGRIMLRSANPLEPPRIISGYLEEEADIQTLIRGVRFLEKLAATKPLDKELLLIPVPECDGLAARSDDFYECYIRNFGATMWHASGSCKMGPSSDPDAVVDSRLRVHRVKGVRVADSSIMPNIVSGNTNIPIIMIGEKTADLIKEDWLSEKHIERNEL